MNSFLLIYLSSTFAPAASNFALSSSASFLLTPDLTLIEHKFSSIENLYHLKSLSEIPNLSIDGWTAIVLFFHDHDWEPPLLHSVLNSNAFYIGAQGSKSAHRQLVNNLIDMGCSEKELSQLRSQIGLIPSARDPKTLAISVLVFNSANISIVTISIFFLNSSSSVIFIMLVL